MSDIVNIEPAAGALAPAPAPVPAPAPFTETSPDLGLGGEGEFSILVEKARRFLYQVLLKHKWMILAIAAVFGAFAVLQSVTTTPTYRSWVKIQIEPESSNALPFKQITDTGFSGSDAYLTAQVAILRSRSLALRVIERLNLPDDAAFNAPRSNGILSEYYAHGMNWLFSLLPSARPAQKTPPPSASSQPVEDNAPAPAATMPLEPPERVKRLVGRFAADLQADVIKQTRMVEMSYVSVDPVESARLVDAILSEFTSMNFEEKVKRTEASSQYLTQRQQEQKAAIEKSEQAALDYAKANGIVDFEGHDDVALQSLNSLNSQLAATAGKVNAAKADYDLIKGATVENFPPVLENNLNVKDMQRRISGLQQQMATLTVQYGPNWPDVVKGRQEIENLEEQLRAEKIKAIEEAKDKYKTVLREQQNAYDSLENQKRVAEKLGEKLIQLKILRSEVTNNRKIYDELIAQTKQADISASLKPDNVRVIDRIGIPGAPFRPDTSTNVMMGLLLGLLVGIGTAGLRSALDTTVKTPEELEMFIGLPSLGIVPTLRQLKPVEQAAPEAGQVAVPDFEPRDQAVIPYRNMLSRAWEPYRALRTAIMMSHSDSPPHVILVTSAIPGEGKSVTSVNLGIVMAKTGARTLLIDLDMRKPRLSEMFGANRQRGMSVYLSGNSEKVSDILETAVPNLYLVASGKEPPNSAELVGSQRMKDGLAAMRREFDFVILDTPPIMACTDAVVLSRQVDGVVLVVRGGHTPRKAVEEAAIRVTNAGGKILGTIMNDIDIAKPEYSYYYGSYYQHYHQYYGSEKS